MALVDNDKPVALKHLGCVIAARQGLKRDEVDDTAAPGSPGTELADLPFVQAEEVTEPLAPLRGERLGVHEHERRRAEPCHERRRP